MRIAFIGCVDFSRSILEFLRREFSANICCLVTKKKSIFNSDFCDLSEYVDQASTPTFFSEGSDQDKMIKFLQLHKPDIIFCFGWSYLLNKEILDVARLGVVGYHPAALPANRGRHPLIWALVLGLKQTASTFFWMDEGADSGDILSQVALDIDDWDDAASLYAKVVGVAFEQISYFYPRLLTGQRDRLKQNSLQANYWRKRSARDGLIDFRMSARSIYNLVRALTKPYVGAEFKWGALAYKVWRAQPRYDFIQENLEPGLVLAVGSESIIVKTADAAIELFCVQLEVLPAVGDYL